MTSHEKDLFGGLTQYVLNAAALIIPLAVIPVFDNYFSSSKYFLMLAGLIIVLALYLLKTVTSKRLSIKFSSITSSLAFLGICVALSSFVANKYPVEQLMGWGGIFLSSIIISLVGGFLIKKEGAKSFITVIIGLTVVSALLSLLQLGGFGPSLLINSISKVTIANDVTFNLLGSPFVAVQLGLAVLITLLVSFFKQKNKSVENIMGIVGAIVLILVNGWNILPGKPAAPLLLPYTVSWSVALDTLRAPQSAMIGVGLENFKSAYTIFKPAWINGQTWWNVQFVQGSNVPFTILVGCGLLGLSAWLWFAYSIFRVFKNNWHKNNELLTTSTLLLVITLLNFFLPTNIALIALQTVGLAYLIAGSWQKEFKMQALSMNISGHYLPETNQHRQSWTIGYMLSVVAFILLVGLTYLIGRATLASFRVYESFVAISQNDAIGVYNKLQSAVNLNPYMASYRRQYAVVNINIAGALANKTELTTEEQQQASQLIQQAIREARAAAALNPTDSQNWSVMAEIYRQLIGAAQDSDQWAVNSYVQAIQTAPTDPNLRIALGGIFTAQQQHQQAVALYQQAADLKTDLPNAYYNLANGYKQLGQLEAAKAAYQRTLVLLQPDSEAYMTASKELEVVEAELKKQADGKQAAQKPQPEQSSLPSITDQNVNQPEGNVVNDPSSQQLNLESVPQASPSPQQTAQ